MATERKLAIVLTGEDRSASKTLRDVGDEVETTGGKLANLGSKISPTVTAAAAAVVAGVGFALKGAFDAAVESQKISRETERVIQTTGASAWTSADQIGNLADKISGLTGADDELVQSTANMLLTFTNVKNVVGDGNDVFDQATGYALDLATVMGTDASEAAVMLGKALNDPVKGMGKLTKAGVTFDDQQKAQIKTMGESGNILGAQKIILQELGKEFGGAAAAAQTPVDALKVQLGNLQEQIGGALVPVVKKGADAISFLVTSFTNLPSGVQTVIVAGAGVATAVAGVTTLAAKVADVFAPVFSIVVKGFQGAQESIYGFTAVLTNSSKVASIASTTLTTGLVGALGVAGIALAAFSIFQTMAANSNKHNTETIKGFADALGDTTGQVEAKTAKFIADELATSKWGDVMKAGGGSAELLTSKITDTGDKMKAWSARILDNQTSLDHFIIGMETGAAFGDEFSIQLKTLQTEQGLTNKETYQLAKKTAELNVAYTEAEGTVKTQTAVQDALAATTGGLSVATKNQVEALKELSDEMRAQTDPYFAAFKSKQDNKKAQDELNQAVRDYGPQSQQAIDKTLAAAQAAISYKGDLRDLESTMVQGNGVAEFVGQLDDLKVAGFDPNTEAAKALGGEIYGVALVASNLDGKTIEMSMTLDARQVKAKMDYLKSEVDPATGYVPLGAVYALGSFAKGGNVQDGPFIVGEQGPELGMKVGSSVRIFSNRDSSRMLETAGVGNKGGDTVNVYVNNSNASAYDIGREVLWSRKVAG